MVQNLNELVDLLRFALPEPNAVTQLCKNEPHRLVTFRWQDTQFLAKSSLEVFELKGQQLFVTGASTLIQASIHKKRKSTRVLASAADVLRKVENLLGSDEEVDAGLKLLGTVKSTLITLAKPDAAR